MPYSANCPVCFNENDFDTEQQMEQRVRQWQDRLTAGGLDDDDRFLINFALRGLRKDLERTRTYTARKVADWTDTQEASNPGYRKFITEAVEHKDMLIRRALDLTQRLAARTAKRRLRKGGAHANA